MAGNIHSLCRTPTSISSTSSCGTESHRISTWTHTLPDIDYMFRFILIGDPRVGKSSLFLRFTEDIYTDNYTSTIGVDFKIETVKLDGKTVKLQIWDTSGQERFRAILPSLYGGKAGVMVVYDVTNQESFNNVTYWMEKFDHFRCKCEDEKYGGPRKILVGTKCDEVARKVVDYKTAKEFADQKGIPVIETSAKDGTNVEQTFIMLAAMAVQKARSGTQ